MKKLISSLLAFTMILTLFTTQAFAATRDIEPRLSYIGIGSYGIEATTSKVLADASVTLYKGDGCKITATLQQKSGSSWISSGNPMVSTGLVSGQYTILEGDFLKITMGKTYRIQYDFYAYVGSAQKEHVTIYSDEKTI